MTPTAEDHKRAATKSLTSIFSVKSAFSFLRLTDQYLILQFCGKHFAIEKLMNRITTGIEISDSKTIRSSSLNHNQKSWRRKPVKPATCYIRYGSEGRLLNFVCNLPEIKYGDHLVLNDMSQSKNDAKSVINDALRTIFTKLN